MLMTYRVIDTRFGPAAIVASRRGLRYLYLPERSAGALRKRVQRACGDVSEDPALLPEFVDALQRYFEGQVTRFAVQLDLAETSDFGRDVYGALRRVPYGRTVSYKELAERAGRPGAARAVGMAMGKNPIPIVIPCHRVLKNDGSLGGFSAVRGTTLKRSLLELEAAGRGR